MARTGTAEFGGTGPLSTKWAHLPELLRKRREEYSIPDGAFEAQFAFDRVAIWQIPDDTGDTFKGSLIVKAQTTKAKDAASAPRGIVVSAGCKAMDEMRDAGIEVGHEVWFVRLSPWRREVDVVDGKAVSVMVLRSSDIIASVDVMRAARADGHAQYAWSADGGQHRHRGAFDTARSDPSATADY